MLQKMRSRSSNTKCNGCNEYIKYGQEMISLGRFGGFHSMSWVKLCRDCIHKSYKEMFNYKNEFNY